MSNLDARIGNVHVTAEIETVYVRGEGYVPDDAFLCLESNDGEGEKIRFDTSQVRMLRRCLDEFDAICSERLREGK